MINKAKEALIVDGLANEEAWEDAEWTDLFMDIQGTEESAPYYNTRVKMLWDDSYFYVYAEMEDEHVWGDIEERDAVIFYNNDFEVFIKPNEFQPYYAEFEVNTLGTLWDLFLARPYRRNGPVLDEWDVNGTKVGIDIQGSLNDPKDIDNGWSIELAIPIAPLTQLTEDIRLAKAACGELIFRVYSGNIKLPATGMKRRPIKMVADYPKIIGYGVLKWPSICIDLNIGGMYSLSIIQ